MWMLSLGILQYLNFKDVFTTIPNYFKISVYTALGKLFEKKILILINFQLSGLPLIPIVIILAVDWKLYLNSNS